MPCARAVFFFRHGECCEWACGSGRCRRHRERGGGCRDTGEPGDDVIFVREDKDATRYILIKLLVKINAQSWTVKQYNPPRPSRCRARSEQGSPGDRQV
jgi:hypothetical protein